MVLFFEYESFVISGNIVDLFVSTTYNWYEEASPMYHSELHFCFNTFAGIGLFSIKVGFNEKHFQHWQ